MRAGKRDNGGRLQRFNYQITEESKVPLDIYDPRLRTLFDERMEAYIRHPDEQSEWFWGAFQQLEQWLAYR